MTRWAETEELAEQWQEILAACPPCALVMQVGWNGIGQVHCERCGQPMLIAFVRLIDPPTEADFDDLRPG